MRAGPVFLDPDGFVFPLDGAGRQVGWKHGETVKELEEARKVKAAAYYAEKKKLNAMRAKAVAQVSA